MSQSRQVQCLACGNADSTKYSFIKEGVHHYIVCHLCNARTLVVEPSEHAVNYEGKFENGNHLLDMKEYGLAYKVFGELCTYHSSDPRSWYGYARAVSYDFSCDEEKALEAIKQACKLANEHSDLKCQCDNVKNLLEKKITSQEIKRLEHGIRQTKDEMNRDRANYLKVGIRFRYAQIKRAIPFILSIILYSISILSLIGFVIFSLDKTIILDNVYYLKLMDLLHVPEYGFLAVTFFFFPIVAIISYFIGRFIHSSLSNDMNYGFLKDDKKGLRTAITRKEKELSELNENLTSKKTFLNNLNQYQAK